MEAADKDSYKCVIGAQVTSFTSVISKRQQKKPKMNPPKLKVSQEEVVMHRDIVPDCE